MRRRSAQECRALFEAQARSGRTTAEFCREHGLSPQYFSLRKKVLGQVVAVAEPSPFVRLEPVATPAFLAVPTVRLRLGRCECELTGVPLSEVVRLMQALA